LQEGHTAHATAEEAEEEALRMVRLYEEFAVTQVRNTCSCPVMDEHIPLGHKLCDRYLHRAAQVKPTQSTPLASRGRK
jgi:hypothetical protein